MSGFASNPLTIGLERQAAGAIGAIENSEHAILAGDQAHRLAQRLRVAQSRSPRPPAAPAHVRAIATTDWIAGVNGTGRSTTM